MKTSDLAASVPSREPVIPGAVAATPAMKLPFELLLRAEPEERQPLEAPAAKQPRHHEKGRHRSEEWHAYRTDPSDRRPPTSSNGTRAEDEPVACEPRADDCDDSKLEEQDEAETAADSQPATTVPVAVEAVVAKTPLLAGVVASQPPEESAPEGSSGEAVTTAGVPAPKVGAIALPAEPTIPDGQGEQVAADSTEPAVHAEASQAAVVDSPPDAEGNVAEAELAITDDELAAEETPVESGTQLHDAAGGESALTGESTASDPPPHFDVSALSLGSDSAAPTSPAVDSAATNGNPAAAASAHAAAASGGRAIPSQLPHGQPEVARTGHSPQVDSAKFLHRVARAFQLAQQRGSDLKLRLSPPELGSLRLELRVEEGVMTARLEAETQVARAALVEHLPVLRERLAEQGIRIERFDVDLMQQQSQEPGARDYGPGWERENVGGWENGRGAKRPVENIPPLTSTPPHPLTDSANALNVIV